MIRLNLEKGVGSEDPLGRVFNILESVERNTYIDEKLAKSEAIQLFDVMF